MQNGNQLIKLLSGPFLALLLFAYTFWGISWSFSMSVTIALFIWMAAWWLTEAISIYFTSLLPLIILPVFGVMPMDKVAPLYMQEVIFLFIGGFLLAYVMEKSGLHTRLALFILRFVPKTGRGVLGGVMTATFIVSMFINNTATAAMLLPAVLGLNEELNKQQPGKSIAAPMLLGLAFSASIGGMATTIGTAPNLIFLSAYHEHFPETPISFVKWLQFGLPMALAIQTAAFFILAYFFRHSLKEIKIENSFVQQEMLKIGPPSRDEKIIGFLILIMFAGFLFKDDIDLGSFTIPGYADLLPDGKAIKESTMMMLICMLFYFIPSKKAKRNLMDWDDFKRVPIGVLFLFGGGFALSKGIEVSGLSNWITEQFQFLSTLHSILFLFLLVAIVTLMSEFASNVATMNILMAVIFNVLVFVDLLPQQVLIAVAMGASIGYALPAATPPNSIVYGTELIKAKDMIKTGFLVDLAAIVIVTLFCYFAVGFLF